MHLPSPSPDATIFYTRVLLVQNYIMISPRNPNDPPRQPEPPRNHVLYSVGRPHKAHEKYPGHELDCLWRGPGAGGTGSSEGEEGGWRTKAVARLPSHEKIRPSTNDGYVQLILKNPSRTCFGRYGWRAETDDTALLRQYESRTIWYGKSSILSKVEKSTRRRSMDRESYA